MHPFNRFTYTRILTVIPNSHSGEGSNSDLKSIAESDSPELKAAKLKIKSVISRFLND